MDLVKTIFQDQKIKIVVFKRSIFVNQTVRKGEVITNKNIKIIRSSRVYIQKNLNLVLGKKFKNNMTKGSPLKRSNFA